MTKVSLKGWAIIWSKFGKRRLKIGEVPETHYQGFSVLPEKKMKAYNLSKATWAVGSRGIKFLCLCSCFHSVLPLIEGV